MGSLLFAVALAGCGGSSSSTTPTRPLATAAPTSTSQLDAVCRTYSPQLNAIGQRWRAVNDNTTTAQLDALGTQTNELFNKVIQAINQVPEPTVQSGQVGHWVGDLGTANTALNELVQAAKARNAQQVNQQAQRFESAMNAARKDRVALGVRC